MTLKINKYIFLLSFTMFVSNALAEERVFYPKDIEVLKRKVNQNSKESVVLENLKETCPKNYFYKNTINVKDDIAENQIRINGNDSITQEEASKIKSDWFGSLMFNDKQLEDISYIRSQKQTFY